MGVAPGDCAVDDGDEVALDQRHASGWLGREEGPESVCLGRVGALYAKVAEGDGEFLIRDASVRPSVCSEVERVDDLRFGECWRGPEQR